MVPEPVSGIVVIAVFGAALKVLPVPRRRLAAFSAAVPAPDPACDPHGAQGLVCAIARMARAGTIEALNSDYRDRDLKAPARSVVTAARPAKLLLPTIVVVATRPAT
jgi:hypothetical protein